MNMSVKKSKIKGEIKDDFSVDENESADIFTFSEGELKLDGNLLKSFSFDSDEELIEHPVSSTPKNNANSNNDSNNNTLNLTSHNNQSTYDNKKEILDHRILKVNPNGRTPAVDGEAFDMVRSYTLRRSTVRIILMIMFI